LFVIFFSFFPTFFHPRVPSFFLFAESIASFLPSFHQIYQFSPFPSPQFGLSPVPLHSTISLLSLPCWFCLFLRYPTRDFLFAPPVISLLPLLILELFFPPAFFLSLAPFGWVQFPPPTPIAFSPFLDPNQSFVFTFFVSSELEIASAPPNQHAILFFSPSTSVL